VYLSILFNLVFQNLIKISFDPYDVQSDKTNIHEDLKQLSFGIVTVRSYGRCDINGFRFRSTKFESSHPLAATTNTGVVCRAVDERGRETNYYGIIRDILEFDFAGKKDLKVVFFKCDWFDPNHMRENQFGMVEVKHHVLNRGDKFILAYQVEQVYYMSYPCIDLKDWWVVYKVNPRERLQTPGDSDYRESQLEVDDVYQVDEVPNNFDVDTEVLPDSLVGGPVEEVIPPPRRKLVPRKKKVTWRPSNRRKRLDPDFEYD